MRRPYTQRMSHSVPAQGSYPYWVVALPFWAIGQVNKTVLFHVKEESMPDAKPATRGWYPDALWQYRRAERLRTALLDVLREWESKRYVRVATITRAKETTRP